MALRAHSLSGIDVRTGQILPDNPSVSAAARMESASGLLLQLHELLSECRDTLAVDLALRCRLEADGLMRISRGG